MNCRTIQRHLLTQENPGQPLPVAEAHLEECAACRDWLHRLLQMERHVRLLPVPASKAKAELKQFILTGKKASARVGPARSFWRRRAPVVGLAASVALLAACAAALLWGPWFRPVEGRPGSIPDPLLANLMQRNLSLARAETAQARITVLADLADDLQGEMAGLAAVGACDDLNKLAAWYGQVVEKGILPQSQVLPTSQRQTTVDTVAGRLERTQRDAWQLAVDYPGCSKPLRDIGLSARNVRLQLKPQVGILPRVGSPARAAVALHMRPLTAPLGPPILAAAGDKMVPPLRGTGRVAPLPPAVHVVEQARRFQRNRDLIASLVDGGLRLVLKSSAQDRAEACAEVAAHLADEIQAAATSGDGPRTVELSKHLRKLLEDGVAANLRLACLTIKVDSPGNQYLLQIGRRTVKATESLLTNLLGNATAPRSDLDRALRDITDGRAEVERALRGRGPLLDEG